MKSPRTLSAITFMSILSWSQLAQGQSPGEVREAPDADNAYQRLGLATKPLPALRSAGQINTPQKYWSGFYWPSYQGGIAQRWQRGLQSEYYGDYLYPVASIGAYQQLTLEQVLTLSPAEKYDLWLNDSSMSLTQSEQQKVRTTAQNFGEKIPTWFGLCDGWALAASIEDEPIKRVRAVSTSRQVVDFYPEDIKALMAYYYASAPKQYVTAGGRCNRPLVTKDAYGRVQEAECRDINPATLHLALDRFVGDNAQRLVIDTSRDEMVWNYPVHSYQFQYSQLRSLSAEPSYRFPAAGTQFLVNVAANMTLVGGVNPTVATGPQRAYLTRTWTYILELDAALNIIGGEWISDDHPDFVWVVSSSTNTQSRVDYRQLEVLAKASRGS